MKKQVVILLALALFFSSATVFAGNALLAPSRGGGATGTIELVGDLIGGVFNGVRAIVGNDCAPADYIQPDAREFTFGKIYKDKYWNATLREGKCVVFTGKAKSVAPGSVDNEPYIALKVEVENAIHPIGFWAKVDFDQQLKNLNQDQIVTVYGRAVLLTDELGVFLKKIDIVPTSDAQDIVESKQFVQDHLKKNGISATVGEEITSQKIELSHHEFLLFNGRCSTPQHGDMEAIYLLGFTKGTSKKQPNKFLLWAGADELKKYFTLTAEDIAKEFEKILSPVEIAEAKNMKGPKDFYAEKTAQPKEKTQVKAERSASNSENLCVKEYNLSCEQECCIMLKEGQLKKGLSLNECFSALCK